MSELPRSDSRVVPFPRQPALERARGEARLAFARNPGATGLADLYQSGCAKVRLPRPEPGAASEAILLNTAGGLTDGDRLATRTTWGDGTTAIVTSQAAERIYRSRGAAAEVTTSLVAGDGATALWLPQETILFDGGRLTRRTEVDLSPSAQLLACESLVFGRRAMGEAVRSGAILDTWRVRCDGRLVFADTFRLQGDIAEDLKRPAVAAGAGALASVIYVGEHRKSLVDRLRAIAGEMAGAQVSCSALDAVTVVRILADDGQALRKSLVTVLSALLDQIENDPPRLRLPRVWFC